nr:unnamed protein product [Callosobruchus analis]
MSEIENSETSEIFEVLHFSKNTKQGEEVNSQEQFDSTQYIQEENEVEEAINILCIIYKNGKLGAAYYNFQERAAKAIPS